MANCEGRFGYFSAFWEMLGMKRVGDFLMAHDVYLARGLWRTNRASNDFSQLHSGTLFVVGIDEGLCGKEF